MLQIYKQVELSYKIQNTNSNLLLFKANQEDKESIQT